MVIRRHFPKRLGTIQMALKAAKEKNDSLPPGTLILTAATQARLNAMEPLFNAAMQTYRNELAAQARQTALTNEAFHEAQMHISHYIQVLDMGIARKKYPKTVRAFYHLDVNSKKLPRLRSAEDIKHWGERIENGDAARIAAGGAPMANPSAAEVKTVVDDFCAKHIVLSTRKDAFHAAQKAARALVVQARKVIRKVWDEVETFYSEDKAPSRRRKARAWGLVYGSDVPLLFDFTITGEANTLLDGAIIELSESGNTVQTKNGTAHMKTQVSDFATFIISHIGHQPHTLHLELPHGKTEYNVAVKMEEER